jgi:hypothetical protein
MHGDNLKVHCRGAEYISPHAEPKSTREFLKVLAGVKVTQSRMGTKVERKYFPNTAK